MMSKTKIIYVCTVSSLTCSFETIKWLQTDLEASDTRQRRYQNLRHLILIATWKDYTYENEKEQKT
jgi:hypothetical protein